jgi:hypothetical protein
LIAQNSESVGRGVEHLEQFGERIVRPGPFVHELGDGGWRFVATVGHGSDLLYRFRLGLGGVAGVSEASSVTADNEALTVRPDQGERRSLHR